jgi:hypothetical protein
MCPTCATIEALPIIHNSRSYRGSKDECPAVPRVALWAFGIAFGTAVLFGLVAMARR